ncbi:MAG: hypothetical protein E7574_03885 [Ruminococcaceae bacterium]|nr:hypothetical protein [Oscillospiraceae bacterium]
MDRNTNQILFTLLGSAIRGKKLYDSEKAQISEDILTEIFKTAKKHNVDHLISLAIKQNGIASANINHIENSIFKAVYLYEQLSFDYKNICECLESAEIAFMPLKGSVIRKYYPEEWMRTSCDIDILVHEKDCDKAADLLVKECGFTYSGKGCHDISLFSQSKTHIELHFDLIEDRYANESSEVLKTVWKTATVRAGYKYWYEMPDEMFYFYHIAHMAKHFENGGCGVRPFIDLWLLDNIENADIKKRNELLKKGNLLKFAESSRKLSQIWFNNEKGDFTSHQMESFIMSGGVYGNVENQIIVQQQKKGGRIKYALSKIFIPYDIIKFYYPVLQKHRWLMPIMQVRRWFKLLFRGHAKSSLKQLQINQNVSDSKAEEMKKFLSNIGL